MLRAGFQCLDSGGRAGEWPAGIFAPRVSKRRGIVDTTVAFDYRRPSFQGHRNVAGFRPIRGFRDSLQALAGGKSQPGWQYRVAAGDKIAVEKLAGEAGETITLGDVLLAGEDGALADAAKVTVSAEIIAQAKSEKVVVFKKRRRHNYRRKNGHRQQMTLLRILSVA
eukprot:gene13225-13332_t